MYSQLIEWSRHNRLTRLLNGQRPADELASALRGRTSNLDDIGDFILAHVVPVRGPLALISQVHRSGGSLLSQLFDGHPALAAYPNELKIGHPTPEDWPPLEPELGAEKCFLMLYEPRDVRFVRKGYVKGERSVERLPFFNVPALHHRIFTTSFAANPPRSQREIIDLYFTAYFNAWLNYQGDLSQKKWITAFAPRFAQRELSVSEFFRCYPDGRLIQIVRDPRTWYPSAKHHNSNLKRSDPDDVQGLLALWMSSANSILENKSRYGDKVIVLRFEHLVGNTEGALRSLATQLEIPWDPALLQPTFNGRNMVANSSFEVSDKGVSGAPLKREALLSPDERAAIEAQCMSLYDQAAALDRAA